MKMRALRLFRIPYLIPHTLYLIRSRSSGFTLIETLVAIMLLTISIVAPMSLTEQSLSSAYYARDQVTASYLTQEGLESVRQIRDHNILASALGTPTDLLAGIPINQPFYVDTRDDVPHACTGACPNLTTDGSFYGYGMTNTTIFNRTIIAAYVKKSDGSDNTDEIMITITVTWQSGGFQQRSISMMDNLYAWPPFGAASP